MEQYAGMDGRMIVTVIIVSFIMGWSSNTASTLPDHDVALGMKIFASAACVILFLLTINLKDLFTGHDFFEVLAIYFFPFILANALPWAISTALIPMMFLGGIVLRISILK